MREVVDRWARNRSLLVALLMVSYSVQSLLITATRQQGKFAYDATAAVLLAEAVKLLFAAVVLPPEVRGKLRVSTSLPYAVPAVLYVIQNRLVFEALLHLSPPDYQLLNNMKLFTTSLVYRIVMQRQLRGVQWLALLLLGLGMALATEPQASASVHQSLGVYVGRGVSIMFVVSWCSAFAGVINEWLIKRSANVLEANLWLYAYGVVACSLQLGDGCGRLQLEGFTWLTWAVVLCNAVLGQSIAFLFRYADSIVKLYAVCAAMAFTAVLSVLLFGYRLHFTAVAGYLVSGISMCLFYAPSEVLQATDVELVAMLMGRRGEATQPKIE